MGIDGSRADPSLQHAIAYGEREGHVVVVVGGERRELALHVEQIIQERALEGIFTERRSVIYESPVGFHGFQIRAHCRFLYTGLSASTTGTKLRRRAYAVDAAPHAQASPLRRRAGTRNYTPATSIRR